MSRRNQVLDALQLTGWCLRQPESGLPARASEVMTLPQPEVLPPATGTEPAPAVVLAPPTAVMEQVTATDDWDNLSRQVSGCRSCRLCETRTRTVLERGNRQAPLMLIGEGPGEQEDLQGRPFVGPAGKLLDAMLTATGWSPEQDMYVCNVVKCRPPGNRNPQPDEMAACQAYLQTQIRLVRPRLIVALGRVAAQSLLATELSVARLRGQTHQYAGYPLVVTYHPAYLLRNLPDKARAWQDLCRIRRELDTQVPGQSS
ncbi:uracil-DNA glycosylase [Laribacter hongkongensis]|uniref:uracil-DNA glycosylase n=1 Tax=Laribacter hongkongensis TaxID=168471 RepID=UPI000426760F|nr:uracil-DNA glycosylase [Laribacter hongkongensis]